MRYMCDVGALKHILFHPNTKLFFIYFNATCFDRCRSSGVLYKPSKSRSNIIWEISQILQTIHIYIYIYNYNEIIIDISYTFYDIIIALYSTLWAFMACSRVSCF
jgi:hypothetical protein